MADTQGHAFVDFETRSRLSLDGGSFKYASDPSTEILITGYCLDDDDPVCFDMRDTAARKILYEALLDGYKFVAHNFLFEIPVIGYQGHRYNWPKIPYQNYRCTMQMAGRAGLPLALEHCADALKLDVRKLDYGKLLIQRFSVPQSNGQFIELDSDPKGKEQFMTYCEIDAEVSREIWRNLPDWTPSELRDVHFDLMNNLRGVPIDVEAARVIQSRVLTEMENYGGRLIRLTNGMIDRVTQVQRIKQWAQRNVNPEIPSCDADHLERILAGEFGEVDDVTREILEMRQHGGKSSTSKYNKYIDCEIDGKVYGMQISFGAHTGRAISKLLNLYNLPKPSVDYDSMEDLVRQLINEGHPEYVKAASTAIRGMITAPEGSILCVADYAAIEARIVFWVSNCRRGIKKYEDKIDNYIDMASVIYHMPYSSVGDDERWVGKQAILGCGYGLGAQGFVNSCARWGVEVPFDLAEESVTAYRDTYPEVVEYWNELEEAALSACRTGKVCRAGKVAFKTRRSKSGMVMLHCKLPSGRLLTYPDVKIAMVTTPWGAKKKAVTYKKANERGFYRESTYGGKLMENICQAIARDIMYYGAYEASKLGYKTLFTVYDEIVAIHDGDADSEEFCEALCMKESWAVGLPLEADGKLMKRYKKL